MQALVRTRMPFKFGDLLGSILLLNHRKDIGSGCEPVLSHRDLMPDALGVELRRYEHSSVAAVY